MPIDQSNQFDLYSTVNTYSIAVSANMVSAGTDNPLILFRNPANSGKTIIITDIYAGTQVSNVSATFKVFSTPTITSNGASQTPIVRNIGSTCPPSVSLVTSLPTISSNGSAACSRVQGQNSNSAHFKNEYNFILMPNTALLITGDPLSNNRLSQITIVWAEI